MEKNKKDLRVEIVKALESKKKFDLYWQETEDCAMTIEAVDEEDAREKFFEGKLDWSNTNYGDRNYLDDSLEITENTEDD